ncbi:MAG: hypothetical protein MUO42_07155, partial [Anaerolineaceae bacterium]|nr:hypothetical protein [Anaerolineaceae bacterium]
TPTTTPTPEFTSTPIMPVILSQDFTSEVTPNPEAVFSTPVFSRQIVKDYQPIEPSDTFENPIDTIYGSFSYDRMITNSQWTALWFRDGELACYETKPWDGASGGFGFVDYKLTPDQWLPGTYEVQIFVGETWKASGTFTITGIPPTPTVTPTATITTTATRTLTPTGTLVPTATLIPTLTFTITPSLTYTLAPSITRTLTITPNPSQTATITPIPSPTLVPTATRFSTVYR